MASEIDFRHVERRSPVGTVLSCNFNNGGVKDNSSINAAATLYNGASITSNYLSVPNPPPPDGVNAYAEFPDRNEYTFSDGSSDFPFSVSSRFFLTTLPPSGERAILAAKRPFGSTVWEWDIWSHFSSTSGPAFFVRNSTASSALAAFVAAPLSVSTWYHLVATYDGSKNGSGLKIYLNGALSATGSSSYSGMSNTSGPIFLGDSRTSAYGHPMNGRIDNIYIFSRNLSGAEVLDLYSNQATNL